MAIIAVVIPCRNEAGYISRCLKSVLNQETCSHEVKVLVVDGMSDDGSREEIAGWAQADDRVNLVDNPARVTPIALNLGIRTGGAEISIILGAHAEVCEGFLEGNVKALREHPDAMCVGGVIENVNENDMASHISLAMASRFGVGDARFRTGGKSGYVDTVAFGAYRREVFEKVGYFDERLVRNQDDEFNYRILRSGGRIWFDPAIRSRYYVRGSLRKLARQYFQYGYWKVFVNRLHGTVTTRRQMVPFLFILFLLTGSVGSVFSTWVRMALAAGVGFWALGAFMAALKGGSSFRGILPVVCAFLTLHVCYGSGYARALFEFGVLRKEPNASTTSLSR